MDRKMKDIGKCVSCMKIKTDRKNEINNHRGKTSKPFENIKTNIGKTKFVVHIIDYFSKMVSLTVRNRQTNKR